MKPTRWNLQNQVALAAAVLGFLLIMSPRQACCADAAVVGGTAQTMVGLVQASQGVWVTLPIYHFGFDVIPEGTLNYELRTRTLRSFFPFDMDITLLPIWGYTGDKVTFTFTDLGDTGDRMAAAAFAVYEDRTEAIWGNLYSSDSQDSFDLSVPVSEPGIYVWLLSWYWTPSTGAEPYSYTITASFPQ